MDLISSVDQMQKLTLERRIEGKRIALVPTMGALHKGHGRLITRAKQSADFVIVSIFVNPIQFTEEQDLQNYPRTPEQDRDICQKLGVDVVFEPTVEEMYPPGFLTTANVSYLSERLEGESRPGHFRGVCTVVLKLFNICQPDVAFFGFKDAQQFVILRHMARDLNLPIEIVGVSTARSPEGLALSSRNKLLSEEDRTKALCLSRSLKRVHFLVKKQGILHTSELLQAVRSTITSGGVEMDYARIVSATTLHDLDYIERGNTFVLVAARVGGVRLIDSTRL